MDIVSDRWRLTDEARRVLLGELDQTVVRLLPAEWVVRVEDDLSPLVVPFAVRDPDGDHVRIQGRSALEDSGHEEDPDCLGYLSASLGGVWLTGEMIDKIIGALLQVKVGREALS